MVHAQREPSPVSTDASIDDDDDDDDADASEKERVMVVDLLRVGSFIFSLYRSAFLLAALLRSTHLQALDIAYSVQMTLDKNTREMDAQIEEIAELRRRVNEIEQNKLESAQAVQAEQEAGKLREELAEELKKTAQLAVKNAEVGMSGEMMAKCIYIYI